MSWAFPPWNISCEKRVKKCLAQTRRKRKRAQRSEIGNPCQIFIMALYRYGYERATALLCLTTGFALAPAKSLDALFFLLCLLCCCWTMISPEHLTRSHEFPMFGSCSDHNTRALQQSVSLRLCRIGILFREFNMLKDSANSLFSILQLLIWSVEKLLVLQ